MISHGWVDSPSNNTGNARKANTVKSQFSGARILRASSGVSNSHVSVLCFHLLIQSSGPGEMQVLTLQISRTTGFLNQSVRGTTFFGKNPIRIGFGLFIVLQANVRGLDRPTGYTRKVCSEREVMPSDNLWAVARTPLLAAFIYEDSAHAFSSQKSITRE